MKNLLVVLCSAVTAILLSSCCGSEECGAKADDCQKCMPAVDQSCPPCAKCPGKTKDGFIIIGTAELEKIVADKSAVILDARSGKYDDGRRIPGAVALNDKSTDAEIAAVVKTKDLKVVTYCAHEQCPASARLARHLRSLGYTSIVEYPQGIRGWAAAGKKIISVK